MRRQALATAWAVSLFASLAAGSGQAADLIWQVENPFRFFKSTRSFALHEAAYTAVRGDPRRRCRRDIIWRTERRLNDPDCKDPRRPTSAPRPPASAISRAGSAGRRRRCRRHLLRQQRTAAPLFAVCERKYSWGTARKTTCCPRRTPSRSGSRPSSSKASPATAPGSGGRAAAAARSRPRSRPARTSSPSRACPIRAIARVSGVSVAVTLPDGRELVRTRRRGRGHLHRRARRFVRLRRKQSRPAGPVQRRRARWSTTRALRGRTRSRARTDSADAELRAGVRRGPRSIRRCCRAG